MTPCGRNEAAVRKRWIVVGAAAAACYAWGQGVPGPAAASCGTSGVLTSGQRQFGAELAADTGLACPVVAAWELAEESGSAARARQAAGNNDWLNIGYTDAGNYGTADSIWATPGAAAQATATWLKGGNSIPGYPRAASGIRAILVSAGRSVTAQISAIQDSGWASSGYPDLPALYAQVA
jgi:hypothetical protein